MKYINYLKAWILNNTMNDDLKLYLYKNILLLYERRDQHNITNDLRLVIKVLSSLVLINTEKFKSF